MQLPLPYAAGSGASISINRGKIQVYCDKGDSTRECADALSDVIISEGGGSTTVVYATTSIKCGDTIVTVSTGTKTGTCTPSGGGANKPHNAAGCTDKGQQVSAANCDTLCGDTKGSGSCTMSKQ